MSRQNTPSYQASESWLERAERVIPLGSQTFSKSRTQLPLGAAPFFATHGDGSKLYDIDGNKYIDYVCSLGAITLGYNDKDINSAVHTQVDRATILSLAGREETLLAEKIIEIIPCAEMVRFGKNGSDATAGCIRIARAATRRDLIAVCGYHGWQDWYIGSTARDLGVPTSTKEMTKKFVYNDIESLLSLFKAHPGEFAAVILEPMSFELPRDDFLHKVQEETRKVGAILIFDEVVTGFRYPGGSAQAFTGVTPDLASIGKGMGNGYPISAVVGRAELMKLMNDVFFSFTMGGELVSIAAARAVIEKAKSEGVYESIARVGQILLDGVRKVIKRQSMEDVLSIAGQPCWNVLAFKDQPGANAFVIKTLFMQECFRRGIFNIGIHFLSYAHSTTDVEETLNAYDEVFTILREALDKNVVASSLHCAPLQPLFKVR